MLTVVSGSRSAAARLMRGSVRWAWAHLLFVVLLAGAVAIRVIALCGYPAPLWAGDSYGYLDAAIEFRPHIARPSGYSVFLWMLQPFHDFTVVVAAQAALGVAAGLLVYAVVWRAGRAAWPRRAWLPGLIAAPAAVPVLYDGDMLELEHMMLADSLFAFLVVAAAAVVLLPQRMSWWTGALAGLLASCAALTRLAGLPFLGLIVGAILLRWSGPRRTLAAVAAAAVAFTVPFGAYMTWFDHQYGTFAVTKAGNVWMYGRTAAFAECARIEPPPELQIMCPERARSDPRVAPAYAVLWGPDSPFEQIPGGIYGERSDRMAGEFTDLAIAAQPGDYLDVVVRDTLRAFETGRDPYPTPWTEDAYHFPAGEEWSDEQALLAARYGGESGRARVVDPYATWIRAYQDHWYVPGPALGALLAVGLAGVLARLRPRGRWGGAALLPWAMGAALVVIPAATADFDYRYLPPAIPFASMAAALALIPGRTFRRRPAAPGGTEPASGSTGPAELVGAEPAGSARRTSSLPA